MNDWNVRQYGDTRWNRFADRLEHFLDAFFMPIFLILLFGLIGLLLLAGMIAAAIAIVEAVL